MSREEELVEGNYKEVYRLSLRLTGSPHAAEDLTQTVFTKALAAFSGFRGDSSARTWLFTITLNESRRRKKETVPLEPEHDPADPSAGTEKTAVANLEAEKLRRLLGKLPQHYREVVVLHYLQHLEIEEISEVVGVPKNTVKTWLFRARDALKGMWDERE